MAWIALAGLLFCCLRKVARGLAQALDPFQTQFLRYLAGADLFLGEPMIVACWIAAETGFVGAMIIVAPQFSGGGGAFWSLMVLASAPLFAASFLITKAMTRRDPPEVIVAWQAITTAVFTLPFAIPGWTRPNAEQWVWFLLTGLLGCVGHWSLTEAFRLAERSATQPVKFVDML